jgi:DNA-binding Xre family transcriptional regulator
MAVLPKRPPRELIAIGEFIKSERDKNGTTLTELSKKAFGSENYASAIALIEKAKKKNVNFMTIVKICKALDNPII